MLKKPAGNARCKAVTSLEVLKESRTHIGGVYAVLDMKTKKKGGNEILQVIEMLNRESKDVKIHSMLELKKSKVMVRKFAHDCGCLLEAEFEGVFCDEVLLDGLHWKGHTCDLAAVDQKGLNSQAAEQLWSRMDLLHFATEYERARYRYFMKNYMLWRNEFVRSLNCCIDVSPNLSRKRVRMH